jgi:hypothetical protein
MRSMRTVCGFGRWVQRRLRRGSRRRVVPVAEVRPLPGVGRPLIGTGLGEQRYGGVRLDQVDGTTCGSAVLIALAAWADPAEVARLEGEGAQPLAGAGFGARFDVRQKQVHRETNRLWPQALGTTPWGAARWLRDHVPAAGRYRVRLVDDLSARDVADVLDVAGGALAGGRPVPLLVGASVPRHYVMAMGLHGDRWRVYEPTSGQVRLLDLDAVRERRLGPVLGFDRLHAVLLPG